MGQQEVRDTEARRESRTLTTGQCSYTDGLTQSETHENVQDCQDRVEIDAIAVENHIGDFAQRAFLST